MNFELHLTLWGILVVILAAVAMYRKWLESHDDHYIHLHNTATDTKIISSQMTHAKRIELLSRLTRYLMAAAILYALVLVAGAVYVAWNSH
jgi:hypothetical protein